MHNTDKCGKYLAFNDWPDSEDGLTDSYAIKDTIFISNCDHTEQEKHGG